MNNDEINKILENHQHWLNQDIDGWENMRANFSGANLCGADLSGVNLRGAIFFKAKLYRVNLCGANLQWANFYGADLYCAKLRDANLYNANLERTILNEADLYGANLRFVDLYEANLEGNSLEGAKNVPFIPMACPDTGSFIGFKRAEDYLVKLRIPEDAVRLSGTGRKCRCNKAEVLEITPLLDGPKVDSVHSNYDTNFIYTVGETVKVDDFDYNRFNVCSTGIHFFINKQEAIEYDWF